MRQLIAGNWKMNGTSASLAEIEAVCAMVSTKPPACDVLICPPATLIAQAAHQARGRIAIGGQNCHSEISGAFTGDVSAEMLKDAGASAVIVGHSERRQYHGETDAIVGAKAKAAWRAGLTAIICISVIARSVPLERLLDLAALIDGSRVPHLQVFIDSPLASRATEVFRRHRRELEDLGQGEAFRRPGFHFIESVEQSMALNAMSGAVILSASGMCEAGRIRHHLRYNLPRPDSTILFVGFQAKGTLGRLILEGAKRVRMSGRDIAVLANVRRIDSYSAHADREELIAWVEARRPVSGSLFLSHGEPAAQESLKDALASVLPDVVLPQIGERYELPAGAPARRLRTGRAELRDVLQHDWQNDYADFAVNLKRKLQRIQQESKRAEAIARMRALLDRYGAHRAGRATVAARRQGR